MVWGKGHQALKCVFCFHSVSKAASKLPEGMQMSPAVEKPNQPHKLRSYRCGSWLCKQARPLAFERRAGACQPGAGYCGSTLFVLSRSSNSPGCTSAQNPPQPTLAPPEAPRLPAAPDTVGETGPQPCAITDVLRACVPLSGGNLGSMGQGLGWPVEIPYRHPGLFHHLLLYPRKQDFAGEQGPSPSQTGWTLAVNQAPR